MYNLNKFEIINELSNIEELVEVKKVIDYALKNEKINNVIFNIIIVDNNYIQKLNREYRKIDSPTDVISFALEDNDDINYSPIRLLGDIYISLDKAKEQAKEYNHSLLRELSFLAVHGLLHLLGYDHMNKEDEKIMFEKQERILSSYGIYK